jgi:acylphosphatase
MTGWVRNEYDRSVTMELQGTDTQISEFFGRFYRAYASYPIDYVIEEKREVAVVESERDFHVRFS